MKDESKEESNVIQMPLKRRTPEEIRAYHDGFNAAIKLAVGSISSNKSRCRGKGDSFKDGMDYAARCIEINANAFRLLVLNEEKRDGQGESAGTDED